MRPFACLHARQLTYLQASMTALDMVHKPSCNPLNRMHTAVVYAVDHAVTAHASKGIMPAVAWRQASLHFRAVITT